MPGQFSIDNKPKLPGAYVDFVAAPQAIVAPSVGSIVAIPFTHDWGPFKQAVQVESLAEFQQIYGTSTTTPGYYAVAQAFKGEGVSGRGGAGAVLCYRTGAAAAAKATKALNNTTPVAAITLTAKYEGTKGNSLNVTVQDYAADSTKTELIIYLGTVEVERYRFADTDIADLVLQINTNSRWVTAVQNVTGVGLVTVTSSAFTGGVDGGTLIAGDWTAMMTALEPFRFAVFCPFDLTDSSILASLKAWAANLNTLGKRFTTIVGGALDENLTAAKTRAASLNNFNFSTIGIGSVRDRTLLDATGNPKIFSTSQFAPRVAGALARRGEAMSLTFARFADIDLLNGSNVQGIADAYDAGIMVLETDSNQNPVRINRARTTYTTTTDPATPVSIFSEPKFVRTMQAFEMEITEWGEDNVIGVLPVNDVTRQTLVGEMRARLRRREEASIIQREWSVVVSSFPPPSDSDNFIKLDYSIKFGRSLEQILNSITVG